MRILALQPYYGGSHLAAMEGWMQHSRFEFTVLQLPPRHWKWRMRQSAWAFAEDATGRWNAGERWDAVFCTDMLNLAEFKGLVLPEIARLPTIAYFHENQFVYPSRKNDQRDSHFEMMNFTTALAADEAWFNSSFNRDSMLDSLVARCKNWPDYPPETQIEKVRTCSRVQQLGISPPLAKRSDRRANESSVKGSAQSDSDDVVKPPVRIVWAARWEHDKGPESLLEILRLLRVSDFNFRISVIGQTFRNVPPAFATIESEFSEVIERWGYQDSRQDYWDTLAESDVFLSTAKHEFFGLSAVEAMAAGLHPIFPNRLVYPELINLFTDQNVDPTHYLYSTSQEASMLIQSVVPEFDPVITMSDYKGLLWETQAIAFDQGVRSVADKVATGK